LLAGAVTAAEEWFDGGAFLSKNLGIYIDVSPLTLIITVIAVYLLLCLFDLLFNRRRRQSKTCRASLSMGDRSLGFDAFIDSGNRLCDTLTGRDALVLRRSLSQKLLTPRQAEALKQSSLGGDMAHCLDGIGEFALLPFSSVGGQGLMLGFGANFCEVALEDGSKATIDRPFVAFADDRLLGDIDGIIGCDTVEV
jgi:hypothetical protein